MRADAISTKNRLRDGTESWWPAFFSLVGMFLVPLVLLPRVVFPWWFAAVPFWKEVLFALSTIGLYWTVRNYRKPDTDTLLSFVLVLLAGAAVGSTMVKGETSGTVIALGAVPYFVFCASLYAGLKLPTAAMPSLALGVVLLALIGGIGILLDLRYGLFKYLNLDGATEQRAWVRVQSLDVERAGFLFTSSTYASSLMALSSTTACLLVRFTQRAWQVNTLLIAAVLGAIGAFATLARVGYAVCLVTAPCFVHAMVDARRRVRILPLWLLLAIMAGCATAYVLQDDRIGDALGDRISTLVDSSARDSDQSNIDRIGAWLEGIQALRDPEWFLGGNVGTHQPRSGQYLDNELVHYESGILIILNETGILGALAFLLLAIRISKALISRKSRGAGLIMTRVCALGGLILSAWITPIWSDIGYSVYAGVMIALIVRDA